MANCREAAMMLLCGAILMLTLVLVCVFVLPISVPVGLVYFLVTFTVGSMSPNSVEDIALQQMEGIPAVAKFCTKHRTPIVIAFVLPMSLIFDVFFYLRSQFILWSNSAPGLHDLRVQNIQEQVRQWNAAGRKQKLATARPGWVTISPKYSEYKHDKFHIKVELYDVLELDIEKRTVRVEPCVSMGQLTHSLLPKGFTCPVLPEMDDLTVGGLVCGCGIESSSHIYGLFQAICTEFEIVDSLGNLLTASEKENPDLFHAIPWSYGSLGFLVSATLRVVPAKPYVKLTYHPFKTIESYTTFFEEQSKAKNPPQFVEGLVYSRHEAVVMTGDMVDEVRNDGTRNSIGHFYKPWFYKHVETYIARGQPAIEYIPLRDYYHRHTRSIFWEAQDIIPIGNHPLFRLFLGWMMPPKVSFLKLTTTGPLRRMYKEQHVIQDMLVPVNTLQESVEKFDEEYNLYPLWLCPMKLFQVPGFVEPRCAEHMFVDIGAYGVPAAARRGEFNAEASGRSVEAFVARKQGFQMLYADSYMTRDEFRSMFDHRLLDKLRVKLKADSAFPEPYAKVCYKPAEATNVKLKDEGTKKRKAAAAADPQPSAAKKAATQASLLTSTNVSTDKYRA
jgi:delta24-sterol reductase